MALYQPKDITGKKYGKLTALHRTNEQDKKGTYKWLCKCECGNYTIVAVDNLRKNGGTQSCGCTKKHDVISIQEYESNKRKELATLTEEWKYIQCCDRGKHKHIIKCVNCNQTRIIQSFKSIPVCKTCIRNARKQEEIIKKEQSKYKECAVCGTTFKADRKTALYCSGYCKEKAKFIKNADKYREKRKINKRLREARALENGKVDYSITLAKLIERDNHICKLCGRKVNENDYVYVNDTFIAGNDYPSIDHIKPLSKGGVHQWDNVQLTHRICNSIKCDKERVI